MTQALASGQRIEIRGFGSFSLSQRSPRIGRNPKSGEQVLVPGKQVPHFKAGKELRERWTWSAATKGRSIFRIERTDAVSGGSARHALMAGRTRLPSWRI